MTSCICKVDEVVHRQTSTKVTCCVCKVHEVKSIDTLTLCSCSLCCYILANWTLPMWQVCCGSLHTILLSDDGGLFVWGRNLEGQLGTGSRQDEVCHISFLPLLLVYFLSLLLYVISTHLFPTNRVTRFWTLKKPGQPFIIIMCLARWCRFLWLSTDLSPWCCK